jgi:O-acetyl-ADP-ribose deacetylase (regulator of RNase III)
METDMIYEVQGDILLTGAQAIVHGIAANDPMNQGLAMSLHQNYPAMHKDFHHYCQTQRPKTGDAWIWGGAEKVRVVKLITQEGGYDHGSRPGKATVKFVSDCLKSLVKIVKKEKLTSIALPALATGVGGLDWAEVEPVIRQRLGELDIPVFVYVEYHKGQQAKEPGL